MKALTLHQPWASLIADGRKTIETRSWPPPRTLVGERIAIHAGRQIGKPVAAQADAMLFRTRALLVRQRTQTINSLRGQLAEFGVIAAQGVAGVAVMRLELAEVEESLPEQVVSMAKLLFEQVAALNEQIAGLEKEIRSRTRARADMKRLMTIPGIGPICAMALHAFAPPLESFGCGRGFAAWVGLTPRQHSTAGKQRLGRITKMGQRDLRQLLVLGATSVLRHMRKREELDDPWLRRMIAEKPPKLVAFALANKMARIIWALSVRKDIYRAPGAVRWLEGTANVRRHATTGERPIDRFERDERAVLLPLANHPYRRLGVRHAPDLAPRRLPATVKVEQRPLSVYAEALQ